MPRRLLRDGQVVPDDWRYLAEVEAAATGGAAAGPQVGDLHGIPSLILPFEQWQTDRERWQDFPGRLGVMLMPVHKVENLAPDVTRFALIAADFPGPSDGRGYTQGRLLRERYRFTGELRAGGYVRRDQLFFLARCGFNSFELPENELATGGTAFATFSAEYQPSNDEGLVRKLQRRE